jgi:hypothetical protein
LAEARANASGRNKGFFGALDFRPIDALPTRRDGAVAEGSMHKFVMWLGGVTAGLGIIVFAFMLIAAMPTHDIAGDFFAISTGGSILLAGAMLYCFGAIVDHLIAIRQAAERQVEIFDKLGRLKA